MVSLEKNDEAAMRFVTAYILFAGFPYPLLTLSQ